MKNLFVLVLVLVALTTINMAGAATCPKACSCQKDHAFYVTEAKNWVERYRAGDLFRVEEVASMMRRNHVTEKESGLKPGEMASFISSYRKSVIMNLVEDYHGTLPVQVAAISKDGIDLLASSTYQEAQSESAPILFILADYWGFTSSEISVKSSERQGWICKWTCQVVPKYGAMSRTSKKQYLVNEINKLKKNETSNRIGFIYLACGLDEFDPAKDLNVSPKWLRWEAYQWAKGCLSGRYSRTDLNQPPAREPNREPLSWEPSPSSMR